MLIRELLVDSFFLRIRKKNRKLNIPIIMVRNCYFSNSNKGNHQRLTVNLPDIVMFHQSACTYMHDVIYSYHWRGPVITDSALVGVQFVATSSSFCYIFSFLRWCLLRRIPLSICCMLGFRINLRFSAGSWCRSQPTRFLWQHCTPHVCHKEQASHVLICCQASCQESWPMEEKLSEVWFLAFET